MVLGCAKQQHCCPGRTFQEKKAFDALNYFLIPEHLWPAGLQLLRRRQMDFWHWRDKYSKAASNILEQTKALLLQACPSPKRARSFSADDVKHTDVFRFISDNTNAADSDYAELRVIQTEGRGRQEYLAYMPEELQYAVIEAGRPDHLRIDFCTHTEDYKKYVSMGVTASFRH